MQTKHLGSAGPAVRELPPRVPIGTLQRQPQEGYFEEAKRKEEEHKKRLKPPDIRPSIRQQIEVATASVGIVASAISVLEVAAPHTAAAAGVGTTIGALLLPIGAFFLGTAIAEQGARRDQAIENFRDRLTASAMLDAKDKAVSMLADHFEEFRPLNEQGRRATHATVLRWRETIHNDIWLQLMQDSISHVHIEEIWQAQYDKWVEGNAQDLYKIYSDRGNTNW